MNILNRNELQGTLIAYQRLQVSRQALYTQLRREGRIADAERLEVFQKEDKRTIEKLIQELRND